MELATIYIAILRIAAPVLAALILFQCIRPLLTFRREPEIWARLHLPDGNTLPVTHWENVIGRRKDCDIVIDCDTVSKNHAVLTRYDDGSWTIRDVGSHNGVLVNGEKVRIAALLPGDTINIGGIDLTLEPATERQIHRISELRTRTSGFVSVANLLLLTLFQMLCALGYLLNISGEYAGGVLTGFGGLIVLEWLLLIFYAIIRRSAFEAETLAFFLCTLGMCVISSTAPGETVKQLAATVLGLGMFLIVGWSLRDLERAKKIRYVAAAAGLGLLVITLLFAEEIHGARNWLRIGGISIQPSELAKVCFVFVGASAMDRIMEKRNIILFIAYSAILCGLLALMNDFGTALIFFIAFLSIAYMRSGSIGTIGLALTAVGFAGVLVLKIAPHALRRFSVWGHVWEDPLGRGYQQVKSLQCVASGGLFGLGAGNGWMKNLFASDTDIVFATISEEWGILMALMMVVCIAALALFCLRSAGAGRSSFYTIGACTAASIMLAQAILNTMGTLDLLPFTGVTFPFVSNGGSSMLASWGLLAFVKAADTRQNASFAIRLNRNREVKRG